MLDLRDPFVAYAVQSDPIDETEADQEDICVGVAQGSETIIVLLTSCVPEAKIDRLVVKEDVAGVGVEDGGDVGVVILV